MAEEPVGVGVGAVGVGVPVSVEEAGAHPTKSAEATQSAKTLESTTPFFRMMGLIRPANALWEWLGMYPATHFPAFRRRGELEARRTSLAVWHGSSGQARAGE